MARVADRLPENAPGDFFVDRSCIDCDACRQIAPATFREARELGQSVVARQPATSEERLRAAMALVACPTASIGSASKTDARAAARAFPEPLGDDVYYAGYASESSFGASSYFVRRGGGNFMVDSPRAARPLFSRLFELGGVERLVLTHRDDVADHEKLRETFGCERVMHARDIGRDTAGVETKIDGIDPISIAPDLTIIPVPGHTRGSIALLYREQALFTGDHLWYDEDDGGLSASRGVCWYSWAEQTRSMERLLDHRFEWILPGHGRRYRAASADEMRSLLEKLVARMKKSQ